jgi:hypothetical protein
MATVDETYWILRLLGVSLISWLIIWVKGRRLSFLSGRVVIYSYWVIIGATPLSSLSINTVASPKDRIRVLLWHGIIPSSCFVSIWYWMSFFLHKILLNIFLNDLLQDRLRHSTIVHSTALSCIATPDKSTYWIQKIIHLFPQRIKVA